MKYMKRINSDGFLPTHYVVYEDMNMVGIYKTKKEAEKAIQED